MAKKGQKFNKYTNEFRQEVLDKYFSGKHSAKMLSKEYHVSENTVWTWVKAYKEGKPIDSNSKRGRPKSDGAIDYKERYEILKKFQAFVKAQREKK